MISATCRPVHTPLGRYLSSRFVHSLSDKWDKLNPKTFDFSENLDVYAQSFGNSIEFFFLHANIQWVSLFNMLNLQEYSRPMVSEVREDNKRGIRVFCQSVFGWVIEKDCFASFRPFIVLGPNPLHCKNGS